MHLAMLMVLVLCALFMLISSMPPLNLCRYNLACLCNLQKTLKKSEQFSSFYVNDINSDVSFLRQVYYCKCGLGYEYCQLVNCCCFYSSVQTLKFSLAYTGILFRLDLICLWSIPAVFLFLDIVFILLILFFFFYRAIVV